VGLPARLKEERAHHEDTKSTKKSRKAGFGASREAHSNMVLALLGVLRVFVVRFLFLSIAVNSRPGDR
jgi:hypothetical protein